MQTKALSRLKKLHNLGINHGAHQVEENGGMVVFVNVVRVM